MSRKRAASPTHIEDYDDDFGDDCNSNGSKGQSNALPVQRNAANARERARMRVLSSAFCRLKTKLPWVPADTKLSKLDTLRLATIYIQQLRSSLATGKELYYTTNEISRFDPTPSTGQNQTSLVWPFTFQQQQQQQNGTKTQGSTRSMDYHTEWFERDSVPANYYDVNFYSSVCSVPNTFDNDKYHQRKDSSNNNNNNNALEHR